MQLNNCIGFGVSLWDNKILPTSSKSNALDDIFLPSSNKNSTDDDIFSSQAGKDMDEATEVVGKPVTTSTSRFKVSVEENDEMLQDLKIGVLNEKEDSLDFELFGKGIFPL